MYLSNRVGFFNKISVANSPPKDCPIIVFEVVVLYLISIKGCNSFSINDMKLSECPEVGYFSLSASTVVG